MNPGFGMIGIDEARSRVLQHASPTEVRRVPLFEACGCTLAEDVASDVDSPPHDKAMVDGYALLSRDVTSGTTDLAILEEITAGMVPSREVTRGKATRIMTGAPIPPGADAVVMVEHTEPLGDGRQVRINDSVHAGQNIMRRATSLARGEVVLERGHRLRGIEIGLLAEVGRAEVLAHRWPQVAVLATGNELVPVGQPLSAGMIRNSNGPMLAARTKELGAVPNDLGIARDDAEELARLVRQGLEADILLLSGGVSAGVLDLVPGILADAGVEQVFHKVNLKPGKPLWFGIYRRGTANTLVFGLPGNPVSSLVCFELFTRPAIAKLRGEREAVAELCPARLAGDYQQRGDRVTYHPARLTFDERGPVAEVLRWHGSADLKALASANALVCFPAGLKLYRADETVAAFPLA